jgi:hypothetical protein
MSEQARIETAIDTTIDNCEVLRARLAKYEDADGKPITTIAEQAREISSLRNIISECATACGAAVPVECSEEFMAMLPDEIRTVMTGKTREIERLSLMVSQADHNYDCDRSDWQRELAALKAQPSGAVHHNLIEALKFYANGDHLLLADPDAWDTCSGEPINFLHDDAGTASVEDGSIAKAALDSLNSSPVSAGDDLTASECACGDQYPANSYGAGFMAANNGVCENCDAANSCGRGGGDERAEITRLIGFEFEQGELQTVTGDELLRVYRAGRAALSTNGGVTE